MKEEFYKIINILKENCINYNLYYNDDEINKIANDLLKDIDINNKYDLSYITKRFMKIVLGNYDSHTDIDFINNDKNYINNQLPLKLRFDNDKLYIDNSNNTNLIGSEIKEINGISVKQLIEEIKSITRYSTEEWLYKNIEDILSSSTQMRILPSLRNINEVDYSIKKDNIISNIKFEIDKEYKDEFKRKLDNYSYEINNDSFIMHLNSCEKPNDYNSMADYIIHIDKIIKENNINNFILDLRGNTGGNQRDIEHLRVYFKNILVDKQLKDNKIENIGKDQNLNISCLVDRNVFSSASLFLSELQELNIPCIGENIGTTYNNFGNPTKHDLDDIGVRLYTSTRYFYRNENKEYKYSDNKDELKQVFQKEPDRFEINKYLDNIIQIQQQPSIPPKRKEEKKEHKKEITKMKINEKKMYEVIKKKKELMNLKQKQNDNIKTLSNNGFLDVILGSIITIILGLIIFMLIK